MLCSLSNKLIKSRFADTANLFFVFIMEKLSIAIQKSGRLSEQSLELLEESGIKLANGNRKLLSAARNFPIEAVFLRDDDMYLTRSQMWELSGRMW